MAVLFLQLEQKTRIFILYWAYKFCSCLYLGNSSAIGSTSSMVPVLKKQHFPCFQLLQGCSTSKVSPGTTRPLGWHLRLSSCKIPSSTRPRPWVLTSPHGTSCILSLELRVQTITTKPMVWVGMKGSFPEEKWITICLENNCIVVISAISLRSCNECDKENDLFLVQKGKKHQTHKTHLSRCQKMKYVQHRSPVL